MEKNKEIFLIYKCKSESDCVLYYIGDNLRDSLDQMVGLDDMTERQREEVLNSDNYTSSFDNGAFWTVDTQTLNTFCY